MSRPRFITLGPAGTCHENALLHYLEFQGIEDFDLLLVDDLLSAIGQVREQPNTFLVQCSAHVQVHLVTERFHEDVFVVDTFIYPTKELGLVVRTDVERAQEPRHRRRPRAATSISRRGRRSSTSRPSPWSRGNLLAGRLRRGPDARASRPRTPRPPARRRGTTARSIRRGSSMAAEALSRTRHRAAQSLAVLRRIGARRGGVRARTGRGRARERPSARAHLARAPR